MPKKQFATTFETQFLILLKTKALELDINVNTLIECLYGFALVENEEKFKTFVGELKQLPF